MNESTDQLTVLNAIDRLRRELACYHGQLKAYSDLQAHCDRQREQLAALNAAHKPIKDDRDAYKRQAARFVAENAKLRELAYTALNFCANGYCEKEYGCHMNNAGSGFGCGFAKACRELGIEEE